jgi:nucleotide-binding universal stress UspA family protein
MAARRRPDQARATFDKGPMLKTLLVAVDGSEHAARAVDTAIELAKAHGSRLLFLSVYKHYSRLESSHSLVRAREVPEAPDETLGALAKETAERAAAYARERGIEDVEAYARRGHPARTIVDLAKRKGVDAIVMGGRGLGDIGGFLLGSVSHKVCALAECTCITVK